MEDKKGESNMQLSKFSDYGFRALLYLARNSDRMCTVEELAKELQTSEHHMKKVVHKLASCEYISSLKGRCGGLKLAKEPCEINLGEVLKVTEDNLNIFSCFQETDCPLLYGGCRLKGIAAVALQEFIKSFSQYTLEELL